MCVHVCVHEFVLCACVCLCVCACVFVCVLEKEDICREGGDWTVVRVWIWA